MRQQPTGRVISVDVSEFETLLSTLPYPMLMSERMRSLGFPPNVRSSPMLGVVRAADGWVGINCLTGQHWLDVCAMLGLTEYGDKQIDIMMGGPQRAEFFARAEPVLAERTVAEIVELSQAMRIPAAPVNDGASVLDCPQYAKRGFFTEARGFRQPGKPYRFSDPPAAPPTSPATGENDSGALPFAGLRVLDLSTFWAGAYLTCYLGAFGADIIRWSPSNAPTGTATPARSRSRATTGTSAAPSGRPPTSTSATSRWT